MLKQNFKSIAIFGGSFDPFHIGHLNIVTLVLEKLEIDSLFIVPTFLNRFKDSFFLEPKTRLELIKDIYSKNDKINIIDYEVKQKRKVPTYETVQYLKNRYDLKKIYLIIGADNLKDIDLWYNFQNFKDEVKFVVISRDGIKVNTKDINCIFLNLDIDISSSQLREKMDIDYIPKQIQQKVKKLWKIE